MPTYIEKALQRFQHPPPKKPQHSPHSWIKLNYGAKQQMTNQPDSGKRLEPKK